MNDELIRIDAAVKKPGLMVPFIHSNGTSGEELARLNIKVAESLQQVLDDLALATPHGRDFYHYEDGALGIAVDQWQSRVDKIKDVLAEQRQIVFHIQDILENK